MSGRLYHANGYARQPQPCPVLSGEDDDDDSECGIKYGGDTEWLTRSCMEPVFRVDLGKCKANSAWCRSSVGNVLEHLN